MIIQCPNCYSENVTNLSDDSNEFICNDCGSDFQANNGIDVEEDDQDENEVEGGFIDLDPETAMRMAKTLKKDNENNQNQ